MGLFSPKWKHKNFQKRIVWVKNANIEISKQKAIVSDLAKNDSHENVRRAAIERIDDQELLLIIAKNDESAKVRKAALRKITNKKVLEEILVSEKVDYVKEVAVKKINDVGILAEMLKKNAFGRAESLALRKIMNRKDLGDIAKNQELLYEIAENSMDLNTIKEAISGITDVNLLRQLITNNPPKTTKQDAIERLGYQISTIYSPSNDSVQQEIFVEIIEKHSDIDVRKSVVNKIKEEDILIELFKKVPEQVIKTTIIKKIDDKKTLIDIACKDISTHLRENAIIRLNKKFGIECINNLIELLKDEKEKSIIFTIFKILKKQYNSGYLSTQDKKRVIALEGKNYGEHADYGNHTDEYSDPEYNGVVGVTRYDDYTPGVHTDYGHHEDIPPLTINLKE